MSGFIPTPGVFFYAESTQIFVKEVGSGNTATVVKQADRSYSDRIFKCLATDPYCVVGQIVYGYSSIDRPTILLRKDYKFIPVGPDVVRALNLKYDEPKEE